MTQVLVILVLGVGLAWTLLQYRLHQVIKDRQYDLDELEAQAEALAENLEQNAKRARELTVRIRRLRIANHLADALEGEIRHVTD